MSQGDFFVEYVEKILPRLGFNDLSEKQKEYYIPQIASLLQERVGLELLPRLNDEQLREFSGLVDSINTTPAEWREFWQAAIPNFEGEVAHILDSFTEDMKKKATV